MYIAFAAVGAILIALAIVALIVLVGNDPPYEL